MNLDYYIDTAEKNLKELRHACDMAEQEIEHMKDQRKDFEAPMKITDIADFLGKSERTIHRYLNSGKLESQRYGDVLECKQKLK